MTKTNHGNSKGYIYLYKVKVDDGTKFLKLGSTNDIKRRKQQMKYTEFGIGKWKLVIKKRVQNYKKKVNILHRKCGFGMMEVLLKNGKSSTECYEPEMKEFIKNSIETIE